MPPSRGVQTIPGQENDLSPSCIASFSSFHYLQESPGPQLLAVLPDSVVLSLGHFLLWSLMSQECPVGCSYCPSNGLLSSNPSGPSSLDCGNPRTPAPAYLNRSCVWCFMVSCSAPESLICENLMVRMYLSLEDTGNKVSFDEVLVVPFSLCSHHILPTPSPYPGSSLACLSLPTSFHLNC